MHLQWFNGGLMMHTSLNFQRPHHAGGARYVRGFPSQWHTSSSHYRHGEVCVGFIPSDWTPPRRAGPLRCHDHECDARLSLTPWELSSWPIVASPSRTTTTQQKAMYEQNCRLIVSHWFLSFIGYRTVTCLHRMQVGPIYTFFDVRSRVYSRIAGFE